jgi:uncharacterized protein (TIGR03435 family)
MRATIRIAALGLICAAFAEAQAKIAFEVASVKPASPDKSAPDGLVRSGGVGGPGTPDPENLSYTNFPLRIVLLRAFDVQTLQLSGPTWLDTARYDLRAKIAPGATKEQFQVMLQNLLTERFGMKFHREKQELAGYELVVAKGGVKMKESGAPVDEPITAENPGRGGRVATQNDQDGLPELAPGRKGMLVLGLGAGRLRITARLQSLADIARMSQGRVGQPVVDKTGLAGTYDFNIDFSNGAPSSAADPGSNLPLSGARDEAPPFLVAIESLGLKLESKKLPFDVVVIDHIEKTPTEN